MYWYVAIKEIWNKNVTICDKNLTQISVNPILHSYNCANNLYPAIHTSQKQQQNLLQWFTASEPWKQKQVCTGSNTQIQALEFEHYKN